MFSRIIRQISAGSDTITVFFAKGKGQEIDLTPMDEDAKRKFLVGLRNWRGGGYKGFPI